MTNKFRKMAIHQILDPTKSLQVLPHLCALGIMTKAPEPGKVKTRLTPPLAPEEAAEMNKCFLQDIAQSITTACQQSHSRGVGVYTPLGAESAYEGILPPDFFLVPQRGHDFGERLIFAAEDLFKLGFASVCLINSDSPTVPALSFAVAANELARPGDRIVLGPSDDGGYYLIGLKKVCRRIFEEIDWSTERVFDQTIRRAEEIGSPVHLLPTGFDVDDRVTLKRLWQDLVENVPGHAALAPNTALYLKKLVEEKGPELFGR